MEQETTHNRKLQLTRLLGFVSAGLVLLILFGTPLITYAAEVRESKGWFDIGAVALGAILSPFAVIAWIIFKISSVLMGLSGMLFNWIVVVLVFQFSTYLGNSTGMLLAWGILRDFANIGLLFGFIFLGIATILDLHSYPWKKTLPSLIIYAVLLNFSLFITEAIIDGTNILSATLYKETFADSTCLSGGQASGDGENSDGWFKCATEKGVAGSILSNLSVSTVMNADNLGTNLENQFSRPIENILKFLMLALLFTIATVVLLAGAFMLLSRAVILAFLMVTSPIGFAGLAIPGLHKIATDWWHKLTNQALFAPVFLLLLLVAIKMSETVNKSFGGDLDEAISFSSGVADAGPLLAFVLVIGFMIAALMVAKNFGIYGADFAVKTAGGMAGAATLGTGAWLGRRSYGAIANNMKGRILKSRFGTTLPGKMFAGAFGYGANASFDMRSTAPFKGISSASKIDFGKVSDVGKKGRAGELKHSAEQDNAYAKSLADARAAEDKAFKIKAEELKRKEDLALANADSATRRMNSQTDPTIKAQYAEQARQETERAAGFKRERAELDAEHAQVRKARLSKDERKISGYYKRTVGDEEHKEDEAAGKFEAAAEQINEASQRFDTAAKLLVKLGEEKAAGTSGRSAAVIDREMKVLEMQQRLAEDARQTAEMERENARRSWETATANREILSTRSKTYDKQVKDPKYAMEQFARTLEETTEALKRASTVKGVTIIDPGELRAGAAKIRSTRGQSELDEAFGHLKHLMQHSESGHKDDHAEPKGGGGGGGGGSRSGGGAPGPAPH
ncbi:MAG: hypothetical protein WBK28_01350 [Minisyncoccia bacterium]